MNNKTTEPTAMDDPELEHLMDFFVFARNAGSSFRGCVLFELSYADGSSCRRAVWIKDDGKVEVLRDAECDGLRAADLAAHCQMTRDVFIEVYTNRLTAKRAVLGGHVRVVDWAYRRLYHFATSFSYSKETWAAFEAAQAEKKQRQRQAEEQERRRQEQRPQAAGRGGDVVQRAEEAGSADCANLRMGWRGVFGASSAESVEPSSRWLAEAGRVLSSAATMAALVRDPVPRQQLFEQAAWWTQQRLEHARRRMQSHRSLVGQRWDEQVAHMELLAESVAASVPRSTARQDSLPVLLFFL